MASTRGHGVLLVVRWQNLVMAKNTKSVAFPPLVINILNPLFFPPVTQIIHSIGFVFILYIVSLVPTLPLSIYSTFVLEEKHGFNKTTPRLFAVDFVKGCVVAMAFGSPFLAAFLSIFKWAGDEFVPWLMAFMYVIILVLSLFPPHMC